MKRYLIAGIALAFAALAVSSAQAGKPRPIPELHFSPAGPYDFGSVAVGRSSPTQNFTLSYVGSQTAGPFATSVSPSAGFSITADTCNGKRISEKKSCTITVRYTPTGSGTSTATLTASTNAGAFDASVSLSGTGFANSAPTADGASASTPVGTATTINLTGSDPDGDFLTFAVATGPSHGTLGAMTTGECGMTIGGPSTCYGSVTYTPAAAYNGTDSFTFTVNDGLASSAAATVSITVATVPGLSINDPSACIGCLGGITFRVSLDNTSATDVTFHWVATNGTAVWGSDCDGTADYISSAQSGTGTITAGYFSTTINFGTCINGPAYTSLTFLTHFTVTISSPSGATITDDTGTGTLNIS